MNEKNLRRFGPGQRWLLVLLLFVTTGLLIAATLFAWSRMPVSAARFPVEFQVPAGSPFATVATKIQAAGLPVADFPLRLLARMRGAAGLIKPGYYEISAPITPDRLIDKMVNGEVVQVEVVVPEGWSFRQLRARLDANEGLRHELAGLDEKEILTRLGAGEPRPEGIFFPDTYRLDKGSSDLDLLRAAYRAMREALARAWQARDADSPLRSPYEALILASIIEKETGRAADRPMIGSVFVNRLRRGMLLQTDPSVIYGLGVAFDGNLRRRDLLTDTPYNTYTRAGLPPTPIAFPGADSLDAAVRPARGDALYFVARGDGSSQFSATLEMHNRAVDKYQRGGR